MSKCAGGSGPHRRHHCRPPTTGRRGSSSAPSREGSTLKASFGRTQKGAPPALSWGLREPVVRMAPSAGGCAPGALGVLDAQEVPDPPRKAPLPRPHPSEGLHQPRTGRGVPENGFSILAQPSCQTVKELKLEKPGTGTQAIKKTSLGKMSTLAPTPIHLHLHIYIYTCRPARLHPHVYTAHLHLCLVILLPKI